MQDSPNQNNPLSYQQFQQQRFMRQEQLAAQAQKAILNVGADSFSQKVMDTLTALRQISKDLVDAQQQLETQIYAQQRQLQRMQQHIDNVCNQLQASFKAGSAAPSAAPPLIQ